MARVFVRSGSDYLESTTAPFSTLPANGLTLAAWFNCTNTTDSQELFSVAESGNNNRAFRINLNGSARTVRAITSNLSASQRIANSSGTWTSGVWAHAAATFPAGNVSRRAWLNGTGGTVDTFTTAPTLLDVISIGRLGWLTPVNYLGATIAEAAIWSAELSSGEIAALAAGFAPSMVRPQSLLFYADLHGRGGASANEPDIVGGYTLIQGGSPTVSDHPRIIYPRRRAAIIAPAAAGYTHPTLSAATLVPDGGGFRPRVTYTFT